MSLFQYLLSFCHMKQTITPVAGLAFLHKKNNSQTWLKPHVSISRIIYTYDSTYSLEVLLHLKQSAGPVVKHLE